MGSMRRYTQENGTTAAMQANLFVKAWAYLKGQMVKSTRATFSITNITEKGNTLTPRMTNMVEVSA